MAEGFRGQRISAKARTSHGGAGAWGLLLMGLPFAGVGGWIVGMGLGLLPTTGKVHGPPWLLPMVGGVFLLAGLTLLGSGMLGLARRARHRRLAQLHPDEPWLADYDWDSAGAKDESADGLANSLWGVVWIGAFAVVAHGVAREAWPFLIGAIILDLILVAIVWRGVYLLIRRRKYGRSRLVFERFPYQLGQSFEAQLIPSRSVPGCRKLSMTLRCVQVYRVVSGSGKNRRTHHYAYAWWQEDFEIEQGGELAAGQPVPVTFLLPEDATLCTAMSEAPPRYWELEVTADTPGVDYKALFLVPVYGGVSRSDGPRLAASADLGF